MSGKPQYTKTQILGGPARVSIIENHKDTILVGVDITRNGRFTIAQAACITDAEQGSAVIQFRSSGAACRNADDKEDCTIGTRLAAGHALRKMGVEMIASTMEEVNRRCQQKHERPFRDFTVEELEQTRAMVNGEMLKRKALAKKKEKQRQKYIGEDNG